MELILLLLLGGGGYYLYNRNKTATTPTTPAASTTATLTNVTSAGPPTATAIPVMFTFSDGTHLTFQFPASAASLAQENANPGYTANLMKQNIQAAGATLTRAAVTANLSAIPGGVVTSGHFVAGYQLYANYPHYYQTRGY